RSSNTAGRPRGCRDHVNRAARLLLAGKGEALARKAVEQPCGSRIYPTAMPTILVGINLVDRGASTASYRRCGISEGGPMSEALLRDIADYFRGAGIAESTFGRLAVNDGKLVGRLRLGGRIPTDTAERVPAFIAREPHPGLNGVPVAAPVPLAAPAAPPAQNCRFYDNRQKYLLFVTTCSEKQV